MKKQHVFAVSGVKNSGKTTLIERLIPLFAAENLSVSVIKHDGHDFVPDVPDTDSYRLRNAGAQGVAVFSGRRKMIIRQCGEISERELMRAFPDSDVIILEGFKYSEYPKIEAVRRDVSDGPVCDPAHLLGIVTDYEPEELSKEYRHIPVYGQKETERLAEFFLKDYFLRQR